MHRESVQKKAAMKCKTLTPDKVLRASFTCFTILTTLQVCLQKCQLTPSINLGHASSAFVHVLCAMSTLPLTRLTRPQSCSDYKKVLLLCLPWLATRFSLQEPCAMHYSFTWNCLVILGCFCSQVRCDVFPVRNMLCFALYSLHNHNVVL